MPLAPGSMVGRYEILAPLGAGGMGVVYRARDTRLTRDVALKLLPPDTLADPEARARMLREARLASSLNHPGICTIHEVGESGDLLWIAMELVDGRTLREVIGARGLEPELVTRYGAQIADALDHAHGRGVIHSDLKSANVMVTPDGRIKVLDFGLARRVAADPSGATLTASGTIAGTPAYLAPEVLRGDAPDARSDLWSLGVLLHEMAGGTLPFHGVTPYEMSAAILSAPPAPLPPRVPAPLRAMIERCLSRDPHRRYRSAAEVRAALEAIDSGAPPRAAAPRRGVLGAIALAIIVVAGVAAVWFLNPGRWRTRPGAQTIRSLAVLPLENFSHDPEQQYFADGMTEELITSLAQMRAVRVISRTSVMRFKGSTLALPAIAKQLGVDAIVEGSVQRADGRVRVTAQLIRAATEENLWSQSYERELRDALSLQNEVAGAIAGEIRAQLSPRQTQPAGPTPVSPHAYELYLRGRASLGGYSRASTRAAADYLNQAIAADSTFAPAYAALAWAYLRAPGWITTRQGDLLAARRATERALALGPHLGYSHAMKALVDYKLDWRWADAEREFKTAIELTPSQPEAHHFYSHFLMAEGRVRESQEQSDAFLALDPLAREAWVHKGWHHLWAGEYETALSAFRRALQIDPVNADGINLMSYALERLHRYPEALAATRRVAEIEPAKDTLLMAALCAAARGERRLAERYALALSKETLADRRFSFSAARVFTVLGQTDEAFRLLDRAADEKDDDLPLLVQDPWLAPLHSDPRFAALLTRMGLRT